MEEKRLAKVKMKNEYDFFIIEKTHLKENKIFPFQLYVFNPVSKTYTMFLNGNRPLTNELNQFLDFLLSRGGKIAILKKQRRTFLTAVNVSASEIPSLKERELHPLEKERIMNLKFKEMYDEKNPSFSLQSEFEKACETDNFERIIEYARIEILTFSVTHSATVSLALHIAKNNLEKDNYLNRIVATAYLMAKNLNILDPDALADIVCGAYLAHIGLSQIPLGIARTHYLGLPEKEKSLYQKHTILGHHLIKKSQLNISDRCKRIILEHHERVSGDGYPSMKYNESIDSFALIIGAVSHLFEYSTGRITGTKQSMKSIIVSMKSKSFLPGLEFDFGDKLYECIITLINTEQIEEKNKAA